MTHYWVPLEFLSILKDEEKKAMAVGDVFSSDESDDDDGGRMKRYIGNSSDSSSDGMIHTVGMMIL